MPRRVEKIKEIENTLLIRELEIAILKVQNISTRTLSRENIKDLNRLNNLLSFINISTKNEETFEPFDWEEYEKQIKQIKKMKTKTIMLLGVKDLRKKSEYKGSVAHTADILRNKKLGIFTDPKDNELYIASYKGSNDNPKIDSIIAREKTSFTESDMVNNFPSAINYQGVYIHTCAPSWYQEGKYYLFKEKLKFASDNLVRKYIEKCAEALGEVVKKRNEEERKKEKSIQIEIKFNN